MKKKKLKFFKKKTKTVYSRMNIKLLGMFLLTDEADVED